MTVDGEFLHYIFPLQFLDSPEWDSLRPTEEGIFQVRETVVHFAYFFEMNTFPEFQTLRFSECCLTRQEVVEKTCILQGLF